ncbi:hypothetical protein BB559_004124 [Furculomyces boomerangus]|uniref:Cytochrome c oxidase subunit VIIc n=2 Tax=Harpellales TaxID=61421 RepID=A0A2T9YGM5_9FUNG|nr:hypothetical protein BB559_004124 [Furculomyces boomerangus]PWA01511.1 hypothetical protein BB558_002393 [Smittium angustum]
MISSVLRSSLKTRVRTQLVRSGHDFPSPNGQNLPFDTQKGRFKTLYISFSALPVVLTGIAYWFQVQNKAE